MYHIGKVSGAVRDTIIITHQFSFVSYDLPFSFIDSFHLLYQVLSLVKPISIYHLSRSVEACLHPCRPHQ